MRRQVNRTLRRRHQHGGKDGHPQAQGAQHQPAAHLGDGVDACPVRPQPDALAAGSTYHYHQVDGRHPPLRDAGSQRRPGNGEPQTVDQQRVQSHVCRETNPCHQQRRAGVLEPAEHPGRGQDQQHGRQARHGKPQVFHGETEHLIACTQQAQRRSGKDKPGPRQHQAQQSRQPQTVAAHGQRLGQPPRTQQPGDRRRRRISQKNQQPDHSLQHRGCQPHTGQLVHTQVAHDGGIGQQEQRLGNEGPERRNGQVQDLSSEGCCCGHQNSLGSARPVAGVCLQWRHGANLQDHGQITRHRQRHGTTRSRRRRCRPGDIAESCRLRDRRGNHLPQHHRRAGRRLYPAAQRGTACRHGAEGGRRRRGHHRAGYRSPLRGGARGPGRDLRPEGRCPGSLRRALLFPAARPRGAGRIRQNTRDTCPPPGLRSGQTRRSVNGSPSQPLRHGFSRPRPRPAPRAGLLPVGRAG